MNSYQPLQEKVYTQLKEKIKNNELVPDVIYSETQMSQELKTSRTPFKIALARLSQEKYIDIIPSKGFRLHVFDEESIINLFQKRTSTETFCIFAMLDQKDTPAYGFIFQKLTELVERMGLLAENDGDINEFLMLDGQFHRSIVRYVNNKEFVQEYTLVISHQVISSAGERCLEPDYMKKIYFEHMEILSAISSGSYEKCYHAVLRHMLSSQSDTLSQIQKK